MVPPNHPFGNRVSTISTIHFGCFPPILGNTHRPSEAKVMDQEVMKESAIFVSHGVWRAGKCVLFCYFNESLDLVSLGDVLGTRPKLIIDCYEKMKTMKLWMCYVLFGWSMARKRSSEHKHVLVHVTYYTWNNLQTYQIVLCIIV